MITVMGELEMKIIVTVTVSTEIQQDVNDMKELVKWIQDKVKTNGTGLSDSALETLSNIGGQLKKGVEQL